MKKKILFFLFILTQFSYSQTIKKSISGTLINAKTLESVPFVAISLKNKGKIITDIADENGNFKIGQLKEIKYFLKIDAVGYKPFDKTILFNDKNFIDLGKIKLEENVENLDAVIIRAETSTIKQKIDRVVINVGKDLTSVGTDAASVLNNVQSVSVDQQTGELSLRGNNNVRVLIDGKPTNIPTDQLLKQLPSNAIKNIELITNPSAKYNPEGNSGIINIELIKNSIVGFNGSANASISKGRNFSGRQGFNLNYKKDNINWYTNYNFGDGKDDIFGELKRDKSIQDTYGINTRRSHFFKLGTDIDLTKKTSLSLFTIQNFNKLNYVNTTIVNALPANNTVNNSVFELTRKTRTQSYDASIRYNFDEKKHILDFGVAYNTNTNPEDSTTDDFIKKDNKTDNFTETINSKTNRTLINLDYSKPFGENISLELGLQYRKLDQSKNNNSTRAIQNLSGVFLERGLSNFDFNRNIYSAYFNYRQQIDKLGVQAGLRAEHYNLNADFYSELENSTTPINDKKTSLYPSLFATYDITKKDQLQASYSRRVDRPSTRQLTPIRTWGTPLLTSQGNSDLKQQFTNSIELKYNRKIAIGNISLTGFYRRIKNVISRSINTDEFVENRLILSYDNFGTANSSGLELSTYLKFTNWWRFNGSSDAYFRTQQGIIPIIQPDGSTKRETITVNNTLFNIRTNNSFNISKKLSLQVSQLYRGKDKNVQRIRDAMFLISLASSYKILNDKGTITLGMSDVFNTFRAKFNSKNPVSQYGEFNWESQKVTLGFVYNFGTKFKIKEKRRPRDEKEAGRDVF